LHNYFPGRLNISDEVPLGFLQSFEGQLYGRHDSINFNEKINSPEFWAYFRVRGARQEVDREEAGAMQDGKYGRKGGFGPPLAQ
jgi:hypothetical protein